MCLLASHLTGENHRELLDAARHQSKRQVEELVAHLRPQPPVPAMVRRLPFPASVRRLPVPRPDGAATGEPSADAHAASPLLSLATGAPAPARPAAVVPLAPQRYKVQFTASAETYEKLRLAQALLRHQIPDGDPAAIFDRALTALLEGLTRQKFAATDRPRELRGTASRSRHIPAAVRRTVWLRDEGRCAFISLAGRRCAERGFLEFHHVVPYSAGGPASVENVQLRCRAHNGFEAEQVFGPGKSPAVKEVSATRGTRSGPSPREHQLMDSSR